MTFLQVSTGHLSICFDFIKLCTTRLNVEAAGLLTVFVVYPSKMGMLSSSCFRI